MKARDKRIAKLRGVFVGQCDRHKWNHMKPISCNLCGMKYKDRDKIKCWSSNWAASKELFDELPISYKLAVMESWLDFQYESKKFADIVSLFWIKFILKELK